MRERLSGFATELAALDAQQTELAPVPLSTKTVDLNSSSCIP
jgi:hypothetical protein